MAVIHLGVSISVVVPHVALVRRVGPEEFVTFSANKI